MDQAFVAGEARMLPNWRSAKSLPNRALLAPGLRSAVLDLTCIELNRLAWRHGLKSSDSQPPTERFVSVTDQPPLETGYACQDFSMQNYIESQNIANFRERLRMEADPVKHKILLQLLADEMAKCAARIKASVQRKSA
jgi:hypothetical protein